MFTSTPFPREGETSIQGLTVRQSTRGRQSYFSPLHQAFEETRSMLATDQPSVLGEPSAFETTLGKNRLTMGPPPLREDFIGAMDAVHEQFCVDICSLADRSQIFEVVHAWVCDISVALSHQKTNETDLADWHYQQLQYILQYELETWNLLRSLYFWRLNEEEGGSGERFNEIIRDKFCINDGSYVQAIIENDPTLKEILLIMDWLESNFSKNGAPDLSEKFFIWENTWEALKRDKLVDKSSSSSMVSNIDPDAPTREGKQLHPLDNEENKKVLRGAFYYIRTGNLENAIAYLLKSGDRMKAAGLSGFRYTTKTIRESEGEESQGGRKHTVEPSLEYLPDSKRQTRPNPDYDINGNRKRDMWKLVTWEVCEKNDIGRLDRALLGSACGHRESMLDVAHSWEDRLWAFLKATVDVMIEETLRGLSIPNKRQDLPEAYWSQKLTIEQCIEKVDACTTEEPQLSPEYFLQLLQKCIMMDKMDLFIEEVLGAIEPLLTYYDHPLLNSHVTRFYTHLLLFLGIVDLSVSQQLIDTCLEKYITIMVEINLFARIPYYVQKLSSEKQIPAIIRHISTDYRVSNDQMMEFLHGCHEHGLDSLAIGMAVVDKLRDEEDDFSVENLEWIRYSYGIVENPVHVMYEFLKYTIWISRKYLTLGKLEKVQVLIGQLKPENVSEAAQMSDNLENTLVREFVCYKVYLEGEEALALWKKALSQRPIQEFDELPPNATTADVAVFGQRKKEQQIAEQKWRRAVDFHLSNAIEKFTSILKFPSGWLRECYDPSDEDEAIHIGAVRRIVLRKVVHVLLRLVQDKNDAQTMRRFVYVLCDEKRNILQELSPSEIANIFKLVEQFTREKVPNIMFLPK